MTRIKLGLIVLGLVLGYFGIRELRLATAASRKPAHVTCGRLIAQGPGENAHVVVEDFVACVNYFIWEGQHKQGPWKKVYIPLLVAGGEWHREVAARIQKAGKIPDDLPLPKNIRLIAKFRKVKNEEELLRLTNQQTMQGMIVNKIESIGSEEKNLLRQGYPGIQFDNCLIFEYGRRPAGALAMVGYLGGGLASVGVGLLWLVLGRRKRRPEPSQPTVSPQPPAGAPPLDDRNPYAQR